jgi:hypothetical protein
MVDSGPWQGVEKPSGYVTPAHPGSWSGTGTGVEKTPKNLDSGFRRNDEKGGPGTFLIACSTRLRITLAF